MMLHGMGINLILVLGAAPQMDAYLHARGIRPRYVRGYRVTDALSMEAAMDAAGFNRMVFEALLSKVRRFVKVMKLGLSRLRSLNSVRLFLIF